MVAETPKLVMLVSQGRETDQSVRDEAFRLWVGLARSWRRVSEQTGIAESTLRLWGQRDNWEERRKEGVAGMFPGMRTETGIALWMAGHYASVRLQQIMHDAAELGIKADDRECKALGVAIDRAGFSPVGNKQAPALDLSPQQTEPDEDLSKLSDDELMKREEQYRARSRR